MAKQMMYVNVATSFTSRRPESILGATVIVGGTELLEEFIHSARELTGQITLSIAVPFVDATTIEYLSEEFDGVRLRTALDMITSRSSAKQISVLDPIRTGWRSCRVAVKRHLHAKVYVARGAEQTVALIGSHNLTNAGRRSNFEAGVFIRGTDSNSTKLIAEIEETITELRQTSITVLDTLAPSISRLVAA
jgi:phosphatidylserine/phosphatidylglycerophosphate/cardiolipin synthase-like enzyme